MFDFLKKIKDKILDKKPDQETEEKVETKPAEQSAETAEKQPEPRHIPTPEEILAEDFDDQSAPDVVMDVVIEDAAARHKSPPLKEGDELVLDLSPESLADAMVEEVEEASYDAVYLEDIMDETVVVDYKEEEPETIADAQIEELEDAFSQCVSPDTMDKEAHHIEFMETDITPEEEIQARSSFDNQSSPVSFEETSLGSHPGSERIIDEAPQIIEPVEREYLESTVSPEEIASISWMEPEETEFVEDPPPSIEQIPPETIIEQTFQPQLTQDITIESQVEEITLGEPEIQEPLQSVETIPTDQPIEQTIQSQPVDEAIVKNQITEIHSGEIPPADIPQQMPILEEQVTEIVESPPEVTEEPEVIIEEVHPEIEEFVPTAEPEPHVEKIMESEQEFPDVEEQPQPEQQKDTQPEPDRPKGWFGLTLSSFKDKLSRTSESLISSVLSITAGKDKLDDDIIDEIEEKLIKADLGVDTSIQIAEKLRDNKNKIAPDQLKDYLKNEYSQILLAGKPDTNLVYKPGQLNIYLITGVNGVGKTTLIGKLAYRFKEQGKKVLVGAGDTFRAAAEEQLNIWTNRAGADILRRDGADPASVVYDSIIKAKSENYDVLLIDTAGRLHNKFNLMEELKKIRRTIEKTSEDSLSESILVLDATTGQNGLQQAKVFAEAVQLTSVALTKLDGSAKGGIIISIAAEMKLPVKLVGVGEKIHDLRDFDPNLFIEALFD